MCGSARFGNRGFLRLGQGLLINLSSKTGHRLVAPLSSHRFARIENPNWFEQHEILTISDMAGFMEKHRIFDLEDGWGVMAVLHEPILDSDVAMIRRMPPATKVVSIFTTGQPWVEAHVRDQKLVEFYKQVFQVHHRCPVVWSSAA